MLVLLLLEALIPGMIKGLVLVLEAETLQRLLLCRSNNNNKVNSLVLLLLLLLLLQLLLLLLLVAFAAVSVLHIAQCIIIICF